MEGLRERNPEEINKQLEEAQSLLKKEIFNVRETVENEYRNGSGNPYKACIRGRLSVIRDHARFINTYADNVEQSTKIAAKASRLLEELEQADEDMTDLSEPLCEHFVSEIESLREFVI